MIRNPKHQVFADEWLIDMNGTRAYKVAYPNIKKDTTARVNASRLLTDANVKQY
ncbi:terminase small subunit, partial [Enterococcus faecalis]